LARAISKKRITGRRKGFMAKEKGVGTGNLERIRCWATGYGQRIMQSRPGFIGYAGVRGWTLRGNHSFSPEFFANDL
jgi:hypothetical protein